MKLVVPVLLIMFIVPTVSAISPPPTTYRLAAHALDMFTYTTLENAQIVSGNTEETGPLLDTWRFWENQSIYVSGARFLAGDRFARVFTAEGYYCTSDVLEVPDRMVFDDLSMMQMPPARLVRRCTDYEIDLSVTDMYIDMMFTNLDLSSSFGWYDVAYSIDEIAERPALVLAMSSEDYMNILFDDLPDYQVQTLDWVYNVFEFPVVENDVALSGLHNDFRALAVDYELFEPVNISVSLLDGFSHQEFIVEQAEFPLPTGPTLFLNGSEGTQLGEPLVWFMPQVELDIYGDWHEPDYWDFNHRPIEYQKPDYGWFYVALACGFFLVALVLYRKSKEGED